MGEPQQTGSETDRRDRRIDLATAVVLGLATLASAWSAYQASLWDGVQVFRLSEASSAGRKAETSAIVAGQQRGLDMAMFQEYATSLHAGRRSAADWLFRRFRPELQAATRAWLATLPVRHPSSAGSPFDRPEYALPAEREARELRDAEERGVAAARQADATGDRYMLLTVTASVSLFLGGIAASFPRRPFRLSLLILACLVLAGVALNLLRLPLAGD